MLGRAPDCPRALENVRNISSKVLVIQIVVVLPEDELCGHVPSKGADSCADVDGGSLQTVEALAELAREFLDHTLPACHIDFREEGVQWCTAPLVQFMVH